MKNCIILSFCIISFFCNSQNDESSIKATINQFFEGVESKDTVIMRSTIDLEGCFLKSIVKKKDGTTTLYSETIDEFFNEVIEIKDLQIKEQLLGFDIKIDGVLGMAWTDYTFFVNNKFSHCGVNVFILIKRGQEWKIMGITDTRRKENCE